MTRAFWSEVLRDWPTVLAGAAVFATTLLVVGVALLALGPLFERMTR